MFQTFGIPVLGVATALLGAAMFESLVEIVERERKIHFPAVVYGPIKGLALVAAVAGLFVLISPFDGTTPASQNRFLTLCGLLLGGALGIVWAYCLAVKQLSRRINAFGLVALLLMGAGLSLPLWR